MEVWNVHFSSSSSCRRLLFQVPEDYSCCNANIISGGSGSAVTAPPFFNPSVTQ
jgi:hypothetical protein